MSLMLPCRGSYLRSLIDLAQLATLDDKENVFKLPNLSKARCIAAKTFKADSSVHSININVIRANGELHLMIISNKGDVKTLWNYGIL